LWIKNTPFKFCTAFKAADGAKSMTELSWIITGLTVFAACVLIGYILHKAEALSQEPNKRSEPRDTQSNYDYWDD
jgi:hypothetical protein